MSRAYFDLAVALADRQFRPQPVKVDPVEHAAFQVEIAVADFMSAIVTAKTAEDAAALRVVVGGLVLSLAAVEASAMDRQQRLQEQGQ